MKINWNKQLVEEINYKCPSCNHAIFPPGYPYCQHVIFVYVEPSGDEAGFDFVTPEFAAAYLSQLQSSSTIPKEEKKISLGAEKQFLAGNLPPFAQQEIKLVESLIDDNLFKKNVTIMELTERVGSYPTKVTVGMLDCENISS